MRTHISKQAVPVSGGGVATGRLEAIARARPSSPLLDQLISELESRREERTLSLKTAMTLIRWAAGRAALFRLLGGLVVLVSVWYLLMSLL